MLVQHYFDELNAGERVSHVVVMGIGEPFDNYENVMQFLQIINDPKGLAIGARHITVSTSGLAHKIKEFAENGLQVNLAISLHAPNNEVRTSMMRINRSFPIEKLMEAIDYYLEKPIGESRLNTSCWIMSMIDQSMRGNWSNCSRINASFLM